MIEWLIIGSIILQLLCAVIAGVLIVQARNGSWRFWTALTVAFAGIAMHHSAWLLGEVLVVNVQLARIVSICAVYLTALGSVAAMAEAAVFHKAQRRKIGALSSNIVELERRLEERERGGG